MSDPLNVSLTSGDRGNANLVYILYLVALVIGVTSLVGVIMAYMAKDKAPDWLKSHYHNQINIFWKALLYCVIGAVLSVILIGFLILLATVVWYIIRVVQGMQALNRNEPIANPGSWLLA